MAKWRINYWSAHKIAAPAAYCVVDGKIVLLAFSQMPLMFAANRKVVEGYVFAAFTYSEKFTREEIVTYQAFNFATLGGRVLISADHASLYSVHYSHLQRKGKVFGDDDFFDYKDIIIAAPHKNLRVRLGGIL